MRASTRSELVGQLARQESQIESSRVVEMHNKEAVSEVARLVAAQLQHEGHAGRCEEEESLLDPCDYLWAARHLGFLRQALQSLMLLVASHLTLYLIHLLHNVEIHQLDGSLHAALVLPSLIVLLALLPQCVHLFGIFEAYAVPNTTVLDHVLSDGWQLDADLQYVCHQITRNLRKNKRGVIRQLRHFQKSHAGRRGKWYRRAFRFVSQLCRGQVETSYGKKHVFVAELLKTAGVFCSHERVARLTEWVGSVGSPNEPLDVPTVFSRFGVALDEQDKDEIKKNFSKGSSKEMQDVSSLIAQMRDSPSEDTNSQLNIASSC